MAVRQLPLSNLRRAVSVAGWFVVDDEAFAAPVRGPGDGNLVPRGRTRQSDRGLSRWTSRSREAGPDATTAERHNCFPNNLRPRAGAVSGSDSPFDARCRRARTEVSGGRSYLGE